MIIRFWLIAGGVRRRRPRPVHRRLHPDLVGGAAVIARLRARRRRRGDRAGAAPARASTSSPSTTPSTTPRAALAAELGVELVAAPDDGAAGRARSAPASSSCRRPACPRPIALFAAAAAAGRPVVSEIELAYHWEQERPGGPRPMLAVTGTDGKTTTTLLAVDDARAPAGVRAVAAGNTDVPLVEALDLDVDAFVVECTSFRLAWTERVPRPTPRRGSTSRPTTSTGTRRWPPTRRPRRASSASSGPTDVAIGFAADPVVMAHLAAAPGPPPHVRRSTGADYHVAGTATTPCSSARPGALGAGRRAAPGPARTT